MGQQTNITQQHKKDFNLSKYRSAGFALQAGMVTRVPTTLRSSVNKGGYYTRMAIAPPAPPKTEPSTIPPTKIPDSLPGPDSPFWKPYREDRPAPPQTEPERPKEAPGGPGGPDDKPPNRRKTGKE